MEGEKKDWLNGYGNPVQLSAEKVYQENAKNHNHLEVLKGNDEYTLRGFLNAFAETLNHSNLRQYLRHLNAANNCINNIDKCGNSLGDVDIQRPRGLKHGGLSETMNDDILTITLGEKKNDALTCVHSTRENRIYLNKERKAEPFTKDLVFPEEFTELPSTMLRMDKAPIERHAFTLETYCERLQSLMKGSFDTECSIRFLLDVKLNNPKPLQGQGLKEVLEKMLCDKNLTEVLELLKRKRVISLWLFDALMNYVNEQQVSSTNTRCEEVDANRSPDGIPRFSITRYSEFLRGRPDTVLKINDGKASLLKDLLFIQEIQNISSVVSKGIHIFQNVKQTLRTDDPKKTQDKEGLTLAASKSKADLFAMVLTVLAQQKKIREAMQMTRLTTSTQEEASPVTASSDSSSLSHSESLSSLEWEDAPTDALRQLLDMGREPLPPDASFLSFIPFFGKMAKYYEMSARGLLLYVISRKNGSETKENNGTDTLPPAKEDKKYQTFEKYFNLVLFVINQLSR